MSIRFLLVGCLTALLSLLPALYLRLSWARVPELVPSHFTTGIPDAFVNRQELWGMVWWPVLAFVVLTCWPQVRGEKNWFWSNPRQRQLRAVVVGALTVCILAMLTHRVRFAKLPAKGAGQSVNSPQR